MKLVASVMITAACSMLGVYASSRASARFRAVEKIVVMISDIKSRLEFVCLPVDDLLEALCADARYDRLLFLKACKASNAPFPTAWEQAVRATANDCALAPQDGDRLSEFGKSLGSTDLAGQLACCGMYLSIFTSRLKECGEARDKYSKMLPTLGTLGGLALSILII